MCKEEKLLKMFNEGTSGNNHYKAERIIYNDLIKSVDIEVDGSVICIAGIVISENLFSEYTTRIDIDGEKQTILSTFCTCMDYEKNQLRKKNYCCKHLVASFYSSTDRLIELEVFNRKTELTVKSTKDMLAKILDNKNHKEEIKIDAYINKDQWDESISVEFKIGTGFNRYSLKDINYFIQAYNFETEIVYSKNFIFDIKKQFFNAKNKRIIAFLEKLKHFETQKELIKGKYAVIPGYLLREFCQIIKGNRIILNEGFYYRPVDTEILLQPPFLNFDLKLVQKEFLLKSDSGMPKALNEEGDVFLYGDSIYLPDFDFCYDIEPYINLFQNKKVIKIPGDEENQIIKNLLPNLNKLSDQISISKNIKDKIVKDTCKFNFYFDEENKEITLTLKVKYAEVEFNIFTEYTNKIIYRETEKEEKVLAMLRSLGFQPIDNKFYYVREDYFIFNFLKNEIGKLQEVGEVFYSENFKGIKHIGTTGIKADLRAGKYNYFEMDFSIGDIATEEINQILRAFRDNKKYFKLKSGEFIDVEEMELKKMLMLLDKVAPNDIEDQILQITKSKAPYFQSYIEENEIRFVKGKKELNEITKKLKNVYKNIIDLPKGLKAELRTYQKIGFNWLNTMDYLGFGGILGDEMGLGKTLQAIAFLLSKKPSKSLIVVPTSLLYNWIGEFEKFAPELRVAAISGTKAERKKYFAEIENYDVLIISYNLLKMETENFNTLSFDVCILDEAQYIKNPNSQNAKEAKKIKASTKFALTGTPMENSVMELWSIFDFIMPGYLYDEKRFSVRYYKKLKESPEILADLNRLIAPFILRRKKKEVLSELPDKIEKNLMLSMENQQKKVYKTYADHVMAIIQKKVVEQEFNTSKIEILAYLTKLRQICLDPRVIMEEYKGESVKIEALIELLNESKEEGHKILVFSQFTSVLKNIGARLKVEDISFSYLDGTIASSKRMELVKAFNEGTNSVFLISLKAGGTGLNLTSADVVIHFDPWWNPAVEEQATDRAHRIGQKNVVEVIKLITKGTIEEKIVLLQQRKKDLISQLMDDGLANEKGISALTEEELMNLFSEM